MDQTGKKEDAGEKELNAFVQNLLSQMQSRFEEMSGSIVTRIDDMGRRIDDLEKSLGDLVKEVEGAGEDAHPSPSKHDALRNK